MASSDINSIEKLLAQTEVDGSNLSFAGRGIKLDDEESAKEIVDAIIESKCLKSLRLEGNTLGVAASKAIAKALETQPNFERAKWSDMFTGRLKSEIPDALRHLGNGMMLAKAQLVELDLSDNAFGPNGMKGLTKFLVSESCYKLQELRLNNNGLGLTGGKMLAKCLLDCYKNSSAAGSPLQLKVFVSGRGRLENEGSTALAEAFKAMGSLEEVSMPQNGINAPGITALADALSENKNLRELNLNDNTFTEVGAAAMAKALPNMQQLEVINFGDCLLRTNGAKAIGKALHKAHPKLRELTVSFNEIRLDGATTVAEAMENKEHLERLELDGNQLGDDGIELIQSTMEGIGKLDQLGSLSDDEGDEDDDDDEVEENSEEEETEENEPQTIQVNGDVGTPKSTEPVSASDFWAFPSPSKLLRIQGNRTQEILSCIGDDLHDTDKAVRAFTKVSAVVSEDDEKSKAAACECADAIFQEVFREQDENMPGVVANSIMVHLGLIKSEDKLPPPKSITGPLIVLEHVVKQKYFPRASCLILQTFLSRPHPLLEASTKSRHKLMQTLFAV